MTILNITSEAWCRKAWTSYYYHNNSMNLTDFEIGQIEAAWSSYLNSWEVAVSDDENEYEIDGDSIEYEEFKNDGRNTASETVGHSGRTGGDRWEVAAQGAVTGVVAVNNGICAAKNIKNLYNNVKSFKSIWKTSNMGTKTGTIGDGKGIILTTIQNVATAFAYYIKKPNQEAKEACDNLQVEMTGAQSALGEAVNNMNDFAGEVMNLSDEATRTNEEANDTIEEEKTEYDMFMETYEKLVAKINAGEPLTDSEKELYQAVLTYLGEIGTTIEETANDTTDEVADLYSQIGSYQENYDEVAETMGNIEGLTDFAAGMDEQTEKNCKRTKVTQYANAGSAAITAVRWVAQSGWIGLIGAAICGTAGGFSIKNANEQQKWQNEVNIEIDMRKAVQETNIGTMDIYDAEIDAFNAHMQGVEDLEMVIPDDTEAPEDAPEVSSLPPEDGTNEPSGSEDYTNYGDILNKPDEVDNTVNYDDQGKVLLARGYAQAITQGLGIPNSDSGSAFDESNIPNIIAVLTPGFTAEQIRTALDGGIVDSSYSGNIFGVLNGDDTGIEGSIDNSALLTNNLNEIINFYMPIFRAAAINGWKCS